MTQQLEEGAGLSQDGRRLPVPRESKLELLLLIQAPLASESPGPPRPAPPRFCARSENWLAQGFVSGVGGKFSGPLLPVSSRCPRDCLQQTGALVTGGTRASGLSVLVTASRKPPRPARGE